VRVWLGLKFNFIKGLEVNTAKRQFLLIVRSSGLVCSIEHIFCLVVITVESVGGISSN